MSFPSTAPIRHDPRPWSFPTVHQHRLPWGLALAAVRLPALPLVQARWTFRGGRSILEDPATGAARLLANVSRHGTARYDSEGLAQALDQLGARLRTAISLDQAQLAITGQSRHLPELLDLADEVAFRPTFPEAELARERASALEVHEHERVQAETVAARWLAWLLYGEHPYGWPPTTVAGLSATTRESLLALHPRLYAPERGLLTVVGDIDPQEILRTLSARYADPPLAGVDAGAPKEAPISGVRRVFAVDRPGSEQFAVTLGHTSLRRGHPDYLALRLANQVFGAGASSRLFLELRERRSLTYGAYSALDAGVLGGDLISSLSTAPAKAKDAVSALSEQWEALRSGPLLDEEIEPARRYLIGSFPQSASGVSGIGALVSQTWLAGLPDDTWSRYPEALAALGRDELESAIQRWIRPSQASLVVVGTRDEAREAAAILGEPEMGEAAVPPWERAGA